MIEYLPEIAPALSCFVDASGCWRYGANGKVVLGWDYAQLESFLRLSGSENIPALFADLRQMERERLKLQSEQIEATKQIKLKP